MTRNHPHKDAMIDKIIWTISRPLPIESSLHEPKRKPRKISRIDMRRDLSWRNYTTPDLPQIFL